MIHLPDESICLTDPLLQKGGDVYWLAPTLFTDYVGFMERIKHQSFPIPHHKQQSKASISTLGMRYGCVHV